MNALQHCALNAQPVLAVQKYAVVDGTKSYWEIKQHKEDYTEHTSLITAEPCEMPMPMPMIEKT